MRLPASDVDPTELVLSGSSSVELLSFSPRFYTVLFLTNAFLSNNIRSPPRSAEIKRSLDKSLNKVRRSKAWDYSVWGLICSWIWRQEKWKEFSLRTMGSGPLLCGCEPVFWQRDRPRWPRGVSSVLTSLPMLPGPRLHGHQSEVRVEVAGQSWGSHQGWHHSVMCRTKWPRVTRLWLKPGQVWEEQLKLMDSNLVVQGGATQLALKRWGFRVNSSTEAAVPLALFPAIGHIFNGWVEEF